jgi:hypothetical protein
MNIHHNEWLDRITQCNLDVAYQTKQNFTTSHPPCTTNLNISWLNFNNLKETKYLIGYVHNTPFVLHSIFYSVIY